MKSKAASQLGCFTLFGFTRTPRHGLEHQLSESFGIVPRIIDFGPAGLFFFYTSYGEIGETEEAIALKLGFIRAPAKSILSTQQLLDQRLVNPREVDQDNLRGDALVACFDKTELSFSVFKTILSGIPLFYYANGGEMLCCDRLRYLTKLIDPLEFEETIIPHHFLQFGTVDSRTLFRNVHRLRPGEHLKWQEGNFNIRLIKDLRSLKNDLPPGGADPNYSVIYEGLKETLGTYISGMQRSGAGFGNLLSGGVDSSLTQHMINEHLPDIRHQSFSFYMHTPMFQPEREYAERAQTVFNTQHVFVDILPKDFPGLMQRSTEALGYPVYMAQDPCKLALAEFLANAPSSPRYFISSHGADSLFGGGIARKIKQLEIANRIPASTLVLSGAGKLLEPFTRRSQTLQKAAMILKDPLRHFQSPINTASAGADLEFILRCFGEGAVRRALELKRAQETEYLDSANYQEKVHQARALSALVYESFQDRTLFMAKGKELIYPFMDEDDIRLSFAVRQEKRYIKGSRVKYILKDILEERSSSLIARMPKRGGNFFPDVKTWMDSGPLYEMVRSIERPGFLGRSDFEKLIEQPGYYFLWPLLTYDLFLKTFKK